MSHPLYDEPTPRRDDHPLNEPPPPPKRPRGTIVLVERDSRLSLALIAINVAIFLLTNLQESVRCTVPNRFLWIESPLFCFGALFPGAVFAEGELYRLLTAMFLHGGIAHLLFNMLALYSLGGDVERLFGRARFMTIYLLGGLGGSVLSAAIGDYNIASVGASGAIFAIWGAQALHAYRHRALMGDFASSILQSAGFFLVLNLVIGFTPGSNIDNWGHIGGLLGGVALTWLIGPRYQLQQVGDLLTGVRVRAVDLNRFEANQPMLMRLGLYTFGLLLLFFVGQMAFQAGVF